MVCYCNKVTGRVVGEGDCHAAWVGCCGGYAGAGVGEGKAAASVGDLDWLKYITMKNALQCALLLGFMV